MQISSVSRMQVSRVSLVSLRLRQQAHGKGGKRCRVNTSEYSANNQIQRKVSSLRRDDVEEYRRIEPAARYSDDCITDTQIMMYVA